ncbi:hypothetical protein KSP39_PZI011580 [Platanthera zijinensis]|uniref:Uncharacterized protein n=1 Tax=Platanthera zijinensis TaxID=2320716 RepID=A0AAP0BHC1_9ASPA
MPGKGKKPVSASPVRSEKAPLDSEAHSSSPNAAAIKKEGKGKLQVGKSSLTQDEIAAFIQDEKSDSSENGSDDDRSDAPTDSTSLLLASADARLGLDPAPLSSSCPDISVLCSQYVRQYAPENILSISAPSRLDGTNNLNLNEKIFTPNSVDALFNICGDSAFASLPSNIAARPDAPTNATGKTQMKSSPPPKPLPRAWARSSPTVLTTPMEPKENFLKDGIVTLDEDEAAEIKLDFENALVGRVLGKNFKLEFLSSQLQARWGPYPGFHINDLSNGCFILFFADRETPTPAARGEEQIPDRNFVAQATKFDSLAILSGVENIDDAIPKKKNADPTNDNIEANHHSKQTKGSTSDESLKQTESVRASRSASVGVMRKNKTAEDYLENAEKTNRGRSHSRPSHKGDSSSDRTRKKSKKPASTEETFDDAAGEPLHRNDKNNLLFIFSSGKI